MKISIDVSNEMSSIGKQEDKVVRIPQAVLAKFGLSIGEFLNLRSRLGEIKVLQIEPALEADINNDPHCAYVTQSIYNQLFVLGRTVDKVAPVDNITLGCDPEAIIVDRHTGNVVAAHRYFRKTGGVGNDGLLLEFRPAPHVDADVVCRNIWALIVEGRKILNSKGAQQVAIWGCSAYNNLTAGFHLHYGLPQGLLAGRSGTPKVAAIMIAAFDYYVGVPSIIPEGNEDYIRRTLDYVNYGKPGGYRLNRRTFEFRLPGGSNLRHPILARGLMALGAVVAEDVASRINTCTDCFSNLSEMATREDLLKLYPNLPSGETSHSIICNPDISLAVQHFQRIKEDVRQMVGYTKRRDVVEEYFDCLDKNTSFSNDIEKNWGEYYHGKEQPRQMAFL